MNTSFGQTIKLHLIDSMPDGILTAEIINWTGHVLYGPRARIVDILRRPEGKKTGVYIIYGKDPSKDDVLRVYVGEGDNVFERIRAHDKDDQKDFWEFLCIITSKDLNLTKAHVRYLESRLISIIKSEARAVLANKSEPDPPPLPEADKSDMEEFLGKLQTLLPVLGVHFIRSTPKVTRFPGESLQGKIFNTAGLNTTIQKVPNKSSNSDIAGSTNPTIFEFSIKGAKAKAIEIGGQMIVLAGSAAKENSQTSLASNIRNIREQLIASGKLERDSQSSNLIFQADVAFESPSAAAAAIAGTSRNGRADWITIDPKSNKSISYGDWQEAQINEIPLDEFSDLIEKSEF